MSRRLPSTPPEIPGFTFVRVLGSGGFADVFLYEQNMPRRQVAVKVLLSAVATDDLRAAFRAEADHMARLSSHPSILTVYQASVSADGRPYLVMEYCSTSLSQRARTGRLPLSEALSTGVRIGSAVETAHRIGVLHRDIKPSNILTTAYGHPVLSDFGIASQALDSDVSESVGLSIPWSAPEVLRDETGGTVASEVWALGATLYSLVAGRSPFETETSDNSAAALMARIEKAHMPKISRADVPESLQLVLTTALARRPADRYADAVEFVRALQAVESELGLVPTPVEIEAENWAEFAVADPEDRTSVRMSGELGTPRRRRRARPAEAGPNSPAGHARSTGTAASIQRSTAAARPVRDRRRTRMLVAILGVLIVVATAIGVLTLVNNSRTIPGVADVSAEIDDGIAVFSWIDPGLADGDAYVVTIDGTDEPLQHDESFSVLLEDGARTCATVTVSRDGRLGAPSAERCVEATGTS